MGHVTRLLAYLWDTSRDSVLSYGTRHETGSVLTYGTRHETGSVLTYGTRHETGNVLTYGTRHETAREQQFVVTDRYSKSCTILTDQHLSTLCFDGNIRTSIVFVDTSF